MSADLLLKCFVPCKEAIGVFHSMVVKANSVFMKITGLCPVELTL